MCAEGSATCPHVRQPLYGYEAGGENANGNGLGGGDENGMRFRASEIRAKRRPPVQSLLPTRPSNDCVHASSRCTCTGTCANADLSHPPPSPQSPIQYQTASATATSTTASAFVSPREFCSVFRLSSSSVMCIMREQFDSEGPEPSAQLSLSES